MNNNRGKSIYDVPSSYLIQAAPKKNEENRQGVGKYGKSVGKFIDKCKHVVFAAIKAEEKNKGKCQNASSGQ